MKGFTKQHEYLEVIIFTSKWIEYSELYSEGWTQKDAIDDLMERVKLEAGESIIEIYVKKVKKYEPHLEDGIWYK